MAHPRYFVPRAAPAAATPAPFAPRPLVHALDVVRLGSRHLADRDYVVAADVLGGLRLAPGDPRDALPAAVQTELAFHEVAAGGAARRLDVAELYLFDLQLVEQPTDASGPLDPVYLYGTLTGPYPRPDDDPAPALEGQLTVTRAEVLHGLVHGAAHAFRYAETAPGAPATYCYHAMLPGGAPDELAAGRAVVLAYPTMPAEMGLIDAANEALVDQLLYDLLVALQEGARRARVATPLATAVLPVPSRAVLEQRLAAEGYAVRGDAATRRAGGGAGGVAGVLASVFGGLLSDRLELPPEGRTADYLALARDLLRALPGPLPPRLVALRERLGAVASAHAPAPAAPAFAARSRPAQHARPVRPPAAMATPPRPPAPAPLPRPASGPPDWMRDFIHSHRAPGARAPRLTSAASTRAAPLPASGRPAWMNDFDSPREPDDNSTASESPAPARPDWMKDFE